jgi:hypothetical protein
LFCHLNGGWESSPGRRLFFQKLLPAELVLLVQDLQLCAVNSGDLEAVA